MNQVTQEVFYDKINPLNVSIKVSKSFPYSCEFKVKNTGRIVGKSVDSYTDGIKNKYPVVTKYFLE